MKLKGVSVRYLVSGGTTMQLSGKNDKIETMPDGLRKYEMIGIGLVMAILAFAFLPKLLLQGNATERSAHQILRETINTQIEIFFHNTDGEWPKAMSLKAWASPKTRHTGTFYFPKGLPQHCAFGINW